MVEYRLQLITDANIGTTLYIAHILSLCKPGLSKAQLKVTVYELII